MEKIDKVIQYQLESYMRPIKDRVSGECGYMLGRVSGRPGQIVVTLKGSGASRFYCGQHQRIYTFRDAQCPDCINGVGELPLEPPVH